MTTQRSPKTVSAQSIFGSDLLVGMLSTFGIRYVALNPGATIRGLHESLVAAGTPEIILSTHEGIAVAIAHGYQKASGLPMAVGLHNIVGLQHATMALFNAWCDRIPMLVLGGSGPVIEHRRRPWIDWIHTARQGELVRDFVKWEHEPSELEAALRDLARGWQIALTSPTGPVYVALDTTIQEDSAAGQFEGFVQALDRSAKTVSQPACSDAQVEGIAVDLATAKQPVILAWGLGRSGGIGHLVDLAEHIQAPVIEWSRAGTSFPSRHPLNGTHWAAQLIPAADLILALNVQDLAALLYQSDDMTRTNSLLTRPDVRLIHISNDVVPLSSWTNEHGPYVPAESVLTADAAVVLPRLVDAIKSHVSVRRPSPPPLVAHLSAVRAEAVAGWARQSEKLGNGLTTANVTAILGHVLNSTPWLLANGTGSGWVHRLWEFTQEQRYLGDSGGAGKGYGAGAAVGAALALKGSGRIAVDIQGDGDLLYTPSALWTAVHYEVPLLVVVLNNGSYYQDERHQAEMSRARERSLRGIASGIRLENPTPDFAGLARSFGMPAFGPIGTVAALASALEQAVEIVRSGHPALVDCLVTEDREWLG